MATKKTVPKKSAKKKAPARQKTDAHRASAYLDVHLDRLRALSATVALEVSILEKTLGVEPAPDTIDEGSCVVCAGDRGKSMGFCAECQTSFSQARKACKDDYWSMLSWAATRARRYALHQRKG